LSSLFTDAPFSLFFWILPFFLLSFIEFSTVNMKSVSPPCALTRGEHRFSRARSQAHRVGAFATPGALIFCRRLVSTGKQFFRFVSCSCCVTVLSVNSTARLARHRGQSSLAWPPPSKPAATVPVNAVSTGACCCVRPTRDAGSRTGSRAQGREAHGLE